MHIYVIFIVGAIVAVMGMEAGFTTTCAISAYHH